jgi:hypothetical protein
MGHSQHQGRPIAARTINRLVTGAQRLGMLRAGAGMGQGMAPVPALRRSTPGRWFARLQSIAGVAYGWLEVDWDGSGWVAAPGGRSGTPGTNPGYELNYATDVPVGTGDGTIVELHPGRTGENSWFVFHRIGGPTCKTSLCVSLEYPQGTAATQPGIVTIQDPNGQTIAVCNTNVTQTYCCVGITLTGTYTIGVVLSASNGGGTCSYSQNVNVTQLCQPIAVVVTVCCLGQFCVRVFGCGGSGGNPRPLAGATVAPTGLASIATDSNGYACFTVPDTIPPPSYPVTASKTGFVTQSFTATPLCGQGITAANGVGSNVVTLAADARHACDDCCADPWPQTLTLTCALGTCTLVYSGANGGATWTGQLVFDEPHAGDPSHCCVETDQTIAIACVLQSCPGGSPGWRLTMSWMQCGLYVYNCPDPFNPCCTAPGTRAAPRFTAGPWGYGGGQASNTVSEPCGGGAINLTFGFSASPLTPSEAPSSATVTS